MIAARPAPIVLYDLAGADDDRRISPFCWRIRLAIAHKGLAVQTLPWRMVEKTTICKFGFTKVPVIVDRGKAVGESWAIANYLDDAYPEGDPLFDSPQARAYALFLHHWAERVLHRALVPLILKDVVAHLHERDLAFFRQTREQAFGKPLEAVMDDSDEARERFSDALAPLRGVLRGSRFLAGEQPAYADYIVFAAFQWARSCSPQRLVGEEDPIRRWLAHMMQLHGGLAASAPGYGDWEPVGKG